MSSSTEDTSRTQRHRRQPLWPWLLMPLAALTIFLGLRNARQSSRPLAAPSAAGQTAPPATQSELSQR
jgi:hypothetical protein